MYKTIDEAICMVQETGEPQWGLVGRFAVDSGQCWIGDPSYILPPHHPHPETQDYKTFLQVMDQSSMYPHAAEFHFGQHRANPGLGVCTSSGYGDGMYPVFAKVCNALGPRITELRIVFIDAEGHHPYDDDFDPTKTEAK